MTPPNPYVGPRSFESGEPLYGRDRELRSLAALLIAERLVLLHSPSGAGKTSLVQAALLPRLKTENFNVLPSVRVNIEPPQGIGDQRFIRSTLLSLEEGFPVEERLPAAQLARLSLDEYLAQRAPEGDVLLIFDQFEEVLTLAAADQESKQAFFAQLGQALRNKRRWALFVMREDFLGALAPFLRPIPNRLETRFRLDLLGADAAVQAIQRPAKIAGVDFSASAAQKLVDDLRRVQVQLPDGTFESQLGPHVEPVQLQVVCYRLWEAHDPKDAQIHEKDLAEVGDVNQSLANYYALSIGRVAQASGATQRDIREWFDRKLITPDGLRGQVRMGAETSEGLLNAAVRRLEDAHIIRAEKRAGQTWYELSHDRLIEPIRADNRAWFTANLSLFQQQATLWAQQGRSEGLLLRGKELAAAEKEARSLALTPDEAAFLEACRQLKRRDDRDRLRNRVITVLAIGATIAMIVAGFLWVRSAASEADALRQKDRASTQEASALENLNIANTQEANARQNQQIAQTQQAVAQEQEAIAQEQKVVAQNALATQSAQTEVIGQQSREITARSLGVLGQSLANSDQQLALLLALYGVQETQPDGFVHYEVNRALNAILDSHLRFSFEKGHTGAINSAAVADDTNLLATAGDDGNVVIWDLTSGDVIRQIKTGTYWNEIRSMDMNPQGTQVATVDEVPQLTHIFDVATGALLKTFQGDAVPSIVRYSPDGSTLVVGYRGGLIEIYDALALVRVASLTGRAAVSALSFNPKDGTLAAGYITGQVEFWDLTTRSLKTTFLAHQSDDNISGARFLRFGGVMGLSFSANGRRLASSGSDRTVKIWDVDTGLGLDTFLGHTGRVYDVAFSPDGTVLASGGDNGELYLWNANTGDIVQRFNGHRNTVTELVFNPQSGHLLSASADGTAKEWTLDSPTAVAHFSVPRTIISGQNRNEDISQIYQLAYSSVTGLSAVLAQSGDYSDRPNRKWYLYDLNDLTAADLNIVPRTNFGDPIVAYQDGFLYSTNVKDVIRHWKKDGTDEDFFRIPGVSSESFGIYDLALSHSQKLMVAAYDPGPGLRENSFYEIIDLATRTSIHQLQVQAGGMFVITPDDQQLVFAGERELTTVDIQSGQILTTVVTAHSDVITDLAISSDGRRLVTASADGAAILWDYTTLTPLLVLRGHIGAVTQARFIHNGATIITAGDDGSVRFWEADSGRLIRLIQDHTGAVSFIIVSDDEQTLITAGQDMNIYVYNIGQNLLEQADQRLTRGDLTEDECVKYLARTGCQLESLPPAP